MILNGNAQKEDQEDRNLAWFQSQGCTWYYSSKEKSRISTRIRKRDKKGVFPDLSPSLSKKVPTFRKREARSILRNKMIKDPFEEMFRGGPPMTRRRDTEEQVSSDNHLIETEGRD
ncbi:hypothetical protein TNIN_367321 [Trichonephila inaurata madagascariensis]|uniref:Uncharacterized protein n=1 Tax=Trichonephila inaurata madagascariensis TaxID=2747483 RepID=A0A8X6X961_9ARAC|nr:hypothetical protein TNIN_367321 [Trichonephila inaurata madagascariensis]